MESENLRTHSDRVSKGASMRRANKPVRVMRGLLLAWRKIFRKKQEEAQALLPSGLPCHVGDEEKLARFLKSRSHFSPTKNLVKYAAYLPSPRDGKSSVFRHSGDPADDLWEIARRELGEETNVRGAGIASAADVRAALLTVAACEPPPRHANIQDWPTAEDPDEAKAARNEVAMVIAQNATLLLRSQ